LEQAPRLTKRFYFSQQILAYVAILATAKRFRFHIPFDERNGNVAVPATAKQTNLSPNPIKTSAIQKSAVPADAKRIETVTEMVTAKQTKQV